MSPQQACANEGRCNAGPFIPKEEYERCNAPIVWPKFVDEDTGRVQDFWAEEMMKIRLAFWKPLGARMIWRHTEYNKF
jgi:hypothetical protein